MNLHAFDRRSHAFSLKAFNNSVKQALIDNENAIKKERLEPIHPQTIVYKNSVNILVGKQGSGKTFTCVYEIAKITQLHPETHLLVVFCKDENKEDPTVRALANMINVPIEYVVEDEAEEYVRNLLECKRQYNLALETGETDNGPIEGSALGSQIPVDLGQTNEFGLPLEMAETLKINDFSRPYLHTIFLFNDIAKSKLFNRATNYFNQLLPICRHIQVSFFLNVQFWKSLPPEIKANATLVFIFGGFDSRQLYYIFSQVPTAMSVRELIDFYRTLGKHDKLIVDCENGDIWLPDSL